MVPTAVLAGGVGAAKFLRGLIRVIDPRRLTVIGNTADDETFFGLHVSPDLDTLTYTLADLASSRRGWGIDGDTFACLGQLSRLHGPQWFQLGDRDLATHLFRTERLRSGVPLSRVTRDLCKRLGVRSEILPMSDDRVRTFVHTSRGRQAFQDYLVRNRARGRVKRIELEGIRRARPAPGVLRALRQARYVIIPPSNPLVSIGPILALPGVREQLRHGRAPVAAISPLIAGAPVKGPAHRMLRGTGVEASARGVALLYRDLVDLFVVDRCDEALVPSIASWGCEVLVTDTLMPTTARATALAHRVVQALSKMGDRRRASGRFRRGRKIRKTQKARKTRER